MGEHARRGREPSTTNAAGGRGGGNGAPSDTPGPTRSDRAVEPLTQRGVVRGVLAGGDLLPHLAHQAEALGLHVVLVDRLEVLLARRDEVQVAEEVQALDDAAHHLAY